MAKRNPTSELNHDNWDTEEEKEEAGRFKVAAEDTLKKREIRVAKRRNLGGEEKGTGGLFKGFTGFSGFGAGAAASASGGISFDGQQQQRPGVVASSGANGSKQSDSNANHLSQLKALNQSVLKWIQKHVSDNPYCVLTPVFGDYERHLASIEEKYPYTESDSAAAPSAISGFKFSASPVAGEGGDAKEQKSDAKSSAPTYNFSSSAAASSSSFAGASAATASGVAPPNLNFAGGVSNFTFGAKKADDKKADDKQADSKQADKSEQPKPMFGFSFGSSSSTADKPAPTFSLLGSGQAQQKQDDDQEEEYQPPKPETREIKEPGAVYTKRCKLFYMLPDSKQWRDKGVGNLHVKPVEGGGKAQLIVRADNTLGTILLNTMIAKEMSVTTNKNNLNFACLPNPPLPGEKSDEPRLVPFLLKVKTEDDAKELLRQLDEQRQQ